MLCFNHGLKLEAFLFKEKLFEKGKLIGKKSRLGRTQDQVSLASLRCSSGRIIIVCMRLLPVPATKLT